MAMKHPYQCIAFAKEKGVEYILAACGPRLLVLDKDAQKIRSEWIAANDNTPLPQNGDDGEHAAKKQKITPAAKPPNVIKLVTSRDTHHVVAVTDDKAIRVFSHSRGELTELSQRVMPKRPCAIQIVPGGETILSADKFGDVYSLPMLPSPLDTDDQAVAAAEPTPDSEPHHFKPSATNLTVHSKRNRQALEAQMKQKNFTPRKDSAKFEHKLLLGHVSMLTDMKYITHDDGRNYIVTTDRDEHIRLSRAPPQAHIIEGFCLGHKDFVNKICQLGRTDILVSGGGDPWLGVWEWPQCKLLRKYDLMKDVQKVRKSLPKDYQLAVSGIWTMHINASRGLAQEAIIIVVCEKIKALFLISASTLLADPAKYKDPDKKLKASIIPLDYNPLDVVVVRDWLVVSSHALGEEGKDNRRLQVFYPSKRGTDENATAPIIMEDTSDDPEFQEALDKLNKHTAQEQDVSDKDLDNLLYGVANLRKRGHLEGQEGQEVDTAANAADDDEE